MQRDKLLAAGGSDVVNQRQVAVWGQGGAAACRSAKLFQQGGKFVPIQGKGKIPVAGGGVAHRQIVAADVALAFRQKNFHPAVILGADHFHLRPVGKLGKGLVVCPRAGTDV